MVMRYAKLSGLSPEIKIVDGELMIGNKSANLKGRYNLSEDNVPTLFVIRVKKDDWWQFVTGFDLVDKLFWIGSFEISAIDHETRMHQTVPSAYFKRWMYVEHVFNKLCRDTVGFEWAIFPEDCFETQQEQNEQDAADAARFDAMMEQYGDD